MSGQHKLNYLEYMQSEEWVKRKSAYFFRRPKQCRACKSQKEIHLHHKTYERLGHERDSDFTPLCAMCHAEVHRRHATWKSKSSLAEVTNEYVKEKQAADRLWKKRSCKKPPPTYRAPAGKCDPVNIGLRKALERRRTAKQREVTSRGEDA